jgi:hypothetical protein
MRFLPDAENGKAWLFGGWFYITFYRQAFDISRLLYHTIFVPSGWLMGVLQILPNLFLGLANLKYYIGMFVRDPVL